MKKLFLLLATVACLGMTQAQIVVLSTWGVYDKTSNSFLGTFDTLPLSFISLNPGGALQTSKAGDIINDYTGTTNYLIYNFLLIKNNTASDFAQTDSLKIKSSINGRETVTWTIKLTNKQLDDLKKDSSFLVLLDEYLIADMCKGNVNTLCHAISQYNTNLASDAGSCTWFKLADNQSIVENTLEEAKIYPNPARNILHIENVESADVKVYNMTGQLVKNMPSVAGSVNMDISDLANGLYIVKMQNGKNSRVEKIQVVK